MRPVDPTPQQAAYWADRYGGSLGAVVVGGPQEGPDIVPCPALAHEAHEGLVIRVAWQLDEIELAHLAKGGTLWLSTWGGLPIHLLEVVPRDELPGEPS
jgi:hypothetical protein